MAQRLLIQGRPIDYHTGVIASKVTPGIPGKSILVLSVSVLERSELAAANDHS